MGFLKLGETMTAQLSKVHPPKVNAIGVTYIKLELITQPDKVWGYTYICPEHYNFGNWEDKLDHQGVWVKNVSWKNEEKKIFDADSKVVFYKDKYNKYIAVRQLELMF